jgi:hypothetical protein
MSKSHAPARRRTRAAWFAIGMGCGLLEISPALFRLGGPVTARLQAADPTRGAFVDGYDRVAVRFAQAVAG